MSRELKQRKKNKKGENLPQPPEDYPHIVTGTTQKGVDFISDASFQPVSA